jgi:branched-chain amino acid transport system substrate-binding protein
MHALLAYTDAGSAVAGSSYLKNVDIPWIQTESGSGRVVLKGQTGLLHGNVYAEVVYTAVAKWIEDQGFRRVGHVAFDAEYSHIVQTVINKHFQGAGGRVNVLPTIWVPYGQAQATLEFTKMVAQKPDVILADIWGSEVVVSSLKRLRELGFKGPVVIAQNALIQPDVKAAGAAGDLAYCTFMWVKDPTVPANVSFSTAFEKMHSIEPNAISEPAYEAAKLLALAIDKAGTYTDVKKVRQAMDGLHYITPRGDPVAILPTRQLYVQKIYMIKGQNGKIVPTKRLELPRSYYDLSKIVIP